MKRIFLFFMCLLFTSPGCAKLAHLQELLVLKDFSDNQAEQGKAIERQNKKFLELMTATKAGSLKEYSSKRGFVREFGPPIYTKPVKVDGKKQERLVYAYADKVLASEKIYVDFDDKGRMTSWKYIPPAK